MAPALAPQSPEQSAAGPASAARLSGLHSRLSLPLRTDGGSCLSVPSPATRGGPPQHPLPHPPSPL